MFVPTVLPVPHSYRAPVPKVAPLAVRVVPEPLHRVVAPPVAVILVGAVDGWSTVMVRCALPDGSVHGAVVPVTDTQ